MVVKAFLPHLFSPPKTPGFRVLGFAQVFINNHTKSVVGRVLLKFLLIITPKARVILVFFRGKHRKNDADLSPLFTNKYGVLRKLKHIFPNTYQRIKSICSPAKGGTGCYKFNYQPGS